MQLRTIRASRLERGLLAVFERRSGAPILGSLAIAFLRDRGVGYRYTLKSAALLLDAGIALTSAFVGGFSVSRPRKLCPNKLFVL